MVDSSVSSKSKIKKKKKKEIAMCRYWSCVRNLNSLDSNIIIIINWHRLLPIIVTVLKTKWHLCFHKSPPATDSYNRRYKSASGDRKWPLYQFCICSCHSLWYLPFKPWLIESSASTYSRWFSFILVTNSTCLSSMIILLSLIIVLTFLYHHQCAWRNTEP